ncbi:MAG: MMPL family transporter [Candidatus Nanoarchaeia archaeon]
MIEKIARRVAQFQVKKPYYFIAIFALITLLMIPGIFQIVNNVEPSLEKVLPQNIDEIQTMNYIRGEYGVDMIYVLVHTQDGAQDVRDPTYINYIHELTQKFETREYVVNVNSLSTQLLSHKDIESIPNTQLEIEEAFKEIESHKDYTNYAYSFSIIELQTTVGSSSSAITQLINGINEDIELSERSNPGTTSQVTGFSAIDYATFSVIMSDFLLITFVSMGVVGIIVWLTFQSLTRGMLPMIIVMNALVWTMGIVGYLGWTITVVSMVAAAMIMGLGIDFGIHQVHTYFKKREEEFKEAKIAIVEVVEELYRAMLGASLTTISGFLALLFGVLPAMKTLGGILAIGIFTTLIGAMFLLPVVIYLYDRNNVYEKN